MRGRRAWRKCPKNSAKRGISMSPPSERRVRILGAGVFGLACAAELRAQGISVEVCDRAEALSGETCSWLAGGM
ncbi:FAD-dependent oxidoreductase, partial [Elstera litoralis]|uniref:FAD-dependent oxidoreductase n=1 Tax=Elstera litoralis TaxID=552518 RepID=UPI0012EDF1CA